MVQESGRVRFEAEVDQNEFLPAGGRTVDAILTVTATGGAAPVGGRIAQIIIVDVSGSMAAPATKMTEAKKATVTAVDTLPDGTPFAVIAGNGAATMVYPREPGTVVAGARTRAEARAAENLLWANGGTAIGRWLELVAHYTGQAELAVAIQEGLRARDAGDEETATAKLGRAVQLAAETGHTDTARLLARVVDVEDARTGTVRLKRRETGENVEIINVRSTKTVRVRREGRGRP
ncbi:hypothetical protein [Catenuloplanes indicus]|nr:hypothetical protein [Catenuloplanes indicus]